jgi:hypothetical protein
VPASVLAVAFVASGRRKQSVLIHREVDHVGLFEHAVRRRCADVVSGGIRPLLVACFGVVGCDGPRLAATSRDDRVVDFAE